MPPADGLYRLLAELRSLSDHELGQVLAHLAEGEQRQILALLESGRSKAEPAFEALVGLSPWLLGRLEAARSPDRKPGASMTEATRKALLEAEEQLAKVATQPKAAAHSPSLFSQLLGRARRKVSTA